MRSRSRTRISRARIFLAAPLLDRRDVVHLQLAALHDDADEGRGDALARRPADLRRVLRPARRVALADDLAVMHDDDRARVVLGLLESPVERGLDAGVGLIGGGVRIADRPRLGRGVRKVARHGDRLEVNVGFAARQDRAALVAVELRRARGDAGAADRDRASRHRRRRKLKVLSQLKSRNGAMSCAMISSAVRFVTRPTTQSPEQM